MKTRTIQSGPITTASLQQYLRGSLSDDERYALEYRLLDDERAQAALAGMVKTGLSADDWQADLADIQTKWQNRPMEPQKTSSLVRWAAVAASLVLLVALGRSYWLHQQEQHLFAEHFTAEPAVDGIRIRGEGVPLNQEGPAYEWYQAGQYEKSLAAFQSHLAAFPEDEQARLYAGIAALQVDQPLLSRQYFGALIAADQQTESAHWYLALAYLQEENENAALDQLEWLLINSEGTYLKKAQALMDALAPGKE